MTGNLDVDAYFDNLALVDLPEPASAGAWGSLAVLAYLGHSRRAAR